MRSSSSGGGAFHLHLPHLSLGGSKSSAMSACGGPTTPKGCTVVRVGREGEEEQQRFVVPIEYLNHPLFARLLKEAEEEYGFHQEGAITIPCHVEYFRQVWGMIDKEAAIGGSHHHHYLLHPLHLSSCFRA